MAPKRASLQNDPPAGSSSEEEDERSSEEEEDKENEEEEQDEPAIAKPLSSSVPAAAEKKPFSKSRPHATKSASLESGSDSDSGSDSEEARTTEAVGPKAKSISPARSKAKRPSDSNSNRQANDSKRAKKRQADAATDGRVLATEGDGKTPGDESKKLFQRVWSEDDEIAILKGMVAFSAKHGIYPTKETNEFHNFIRKSLHADVSKAQLMDKIRRMKMKYKNNAGKGKNGEDPNFTKPHEKKAFELSKKVWTTEGLKQVKSSWKPRNSKTMASVKEELDSKEAGKMDINQSSSSMLSLREMTLFDKSMGLSGLGDDVGKRGFELIGESKRAELEERWSSMLSLREMTRFDKSMGLSGLGDDVGKRGFELIGESKRAELEERWKNLQVDELELHCKRSELIKDQAMLIWEAYKSSNR